jgi:hypothetical protein
MIRSSVTAPTVEHASTSSAQENTHAPRDAVPNIFYVTLRILFGVDTNSSLLETERL